MKLLGSLMVVLIFQQAIARIIRKPPAFATPVYSNSYLPAVMQVIFHSVEQLKMLQEEEASHDSSATTTSSTIHSMKHQQAHSTTTVSISAFPTATTVGDETTETPRPSSTSSAMVEVTSNVSPVSYDDLTEAAQRVATSTTSVPAAPDGGHEESPEVNEETTETNYATPETNHESPEPVQELQESNQEVSEESDEEKSPSITEMSDDATSQQADPSQQQLTQVPSEEAELLDGQKKKEPTVDSVVGEVYEIVKPTTKSTLPSVEESRLTDEAKSATESRDPIEKMENNEDEEEDTRFTLLGEKVAQVPRPSLSSYLRRAKVPPRRSLQQLASLYDALSKDARKQGFARFTGYSDEVLRSLHSSAEGGVGPQLKQLLERMIQRNELTREDAKMRTSEALRDLDDSASALNNDLRRILPLRYAA